MGIIGIVDKHRHQSEVQDYKAFDTFYIEDDPMGCQGSSGFKV